MRLSNKFWLWSVVPFLIGAPSHAGMQLRSQGFRFGSHPPGKLNLISDVPGVSVGHATVNATKGKSVARTGVTVLMPTSDDLWSRPVAAAVHTFNGIGEATGFAIVKESGVLQTPIAMTNTLSVGDVSKALSQYVISKHPETESPIPVVMECDDSSLSDIHGFHVGGEEVKSAMKSAATQFAEGSVGAGTGMIAYDFKAGIGSSSRVVTESQSKKKYTVGILVNANIGTGTRQVFRFLGVPVGNLIKDLQPTEKPWHPKGSGSLVMAVATDAPMDSRQLERLAKRALSGMFRTGTPGYNGSGDFVIAFSTANRFPVKATRQNVVTLCDSCLNDFFEATADAAEEAILSSMAASTEMKGRDGNFVYAIPLPRLKSAVYAE